jgi:hypothetical protein
MRLRLNRCPHGVEGGNDADLLLTNISTSEISSQMESDAKNHRRLPGQQITSTSSPLNEVERIEQAQQVPSDRKRA